MKPPERCKGCAYARTIYTGPAVGYSNGKQWTFLGCAHAPYRGKWVREIKECPKDEQRKAEDATDKNVGKWEEPEPEGVWSWDKRAYARCSVCKKKSYLGWKDPYCRFCGAKMMPEPPKETYYGAD